MPINRGPWNALVDDDGSNLVGSIWNKAAIKTVLLDPTDAFVSNGGTWAPWAVSWVANAGGQSLGNGTLTGRYTLTGNIVTVALALLFGSTTVAGTGYWKFGLPFTPSTVFPEHQTNFYAGCTNAGSGQAPLAAYFAGGTVHCVTSAGALVGGTVPFTWATNCALMIRGTYEI